MRCVGCAAIAIVAVATSASASEFDACEAALRINAHDRAAAECFWKAAGTDRRPEARRRLAQAQQTHPESGWITFYLAELQADRRDTLALCRLAVEKFVRRSDAVGEVESRLRLGPILFESNRRDEAWSESLRAIDAARKSGDALLHTRAILYEADLAQDTGERLGHSARLLEEAEGLVFPNGPYALKRRVLGGLGKLAYDMGRYDQARAFYDRLIDLARENNDQMLVVLGAYSSLTARRKQMEEVPEPERLPEFAAAARDLVAQADALGQPRFQSMAHRTLGDLLWPVLETRAEAEAHYRLALAHARKASDPSELTSALWALGRVLTGTSPDESRRLIDEALQRAVDSGSATTAAYAWRQQMRVAWKTLPRERATAESLRALNAIEVVRTLQGPGEARADVLAAWTPDYYWLIGALLDTDAPTAADVALAFTVAERMRARVLLESLSRQPAAIDRDSKAAIPRQQLLREISLVQRRLLDPRLHGDARTTAIARLEQLERDEEIARVAANGESTASATAAVAPLDTIEKTLRDDEALLSFSIGIGRNFYGEFAGGAWLFVTTNRGTHTVRLPDRTTLHGIVAVFRGLVEHDDKRTPDASTRLHDVLLRDARQLLPATVRRLIIVPDGPLHHVPFSALRSAPTSEPLGLTSDVVVAPSANVWLRLRQGQSGILPGAVLVMADPALPNAIAIDAAAQERDWSPEMMRLGRLPHSRAEGRSIVASLGGESRLLIGADATEAVLRSESLGRFGVVHFATHALVDEVRPARSAIVLAANATDDDGLLQAREIADLPLRGRIVVLSACRSATGAVLAGEGVLGLSRSFFEAGARSVVGTLWTIRDDHAARFFDVFYQELSKGRTVGIAMGEARRAAIARGLPTSAWSSVVVIGDDSLTTAALPHGRFPLSLVLVATGVMVLAVLGALAQRRGRPRVLSSQALVQAAETRANDDAMNR